MQLPISVLRKKRQAVLFLFSLPTADVGVVMGHVGPHRERQYPRNAGATNIEVARVPEC